MKLLIISGFHFDYGLTVARAFEELGHEIHYCGQSFQNKGFTGFLRYSIMGRLGYDPKITDLRDFIKETKKTISTLEPDGILVLRGIRRDFYTEIITDHIGCLRKRPKTAIWLLDEVRNIDGGLTCPELFDNWFSVALSDIPLLKKEWGIKAHFLPPAYDSNNYRVLNENEKSQGPISDISFVGTVLGSMSQKTRLEYLEHLAKKSWENNLKFQMITGRFKFPAIKLRKYPYIRKYISYEDCDHQRNNRIYCNSKINFNIQADYTVDSINARFFEILGSGGLQLVEPKEAQIVAGFEPEKDFLTYTGLEDLDEKIKFVFDNPEKAREIANSGHAKAKNHDYLSRAKFVIDQAFS